MDQTGRLRTIEVACAGALHTIIPALARAFEQSAGHKIAVKFDRSGVVKARVLDGDVVDVAITTRAAIDELARRRKVAPDSIANVASSRIGVAVRTGAPKPEIGSVAAFRRALLDAKSIACADPATGSPSGNHFFALLRRLGIAAAIAPKLRLVGAGEKSSVVVVCAAVASGQAEIGIQQIAEILSVPGVDLAGPLPDELQAITIFAAAVPASAREPALARAFIAFIASEAAALEITAAGMAPAPR